MSFLIFFPLIGFPCWTLEETWTLGVTLVKDLDERQDDGDSRKMGIFFVSALFLLKIGGLKCVLASKPHLLAVKCVVAP